MFGSVKLIQGKPLSSFIICFTENIKTSVRILRSSPGVVFWSIGGTGTLCRMRVLAGLGLWFTGRAVTHTGLGWIRGLLLKMLLAFIVDEEKTKTIKEKYDYHPVKIILRYIRSMSTM